MLEAFHLGGWGMYPTLVAGLFLLWSAARYARRQERSLLTLTAMLAAVTLAAGGLGFTTGLMKTLESAAGDPRQGEFIALGTFESLNNIALALSFVVLAGIVSAFGAWRGSRQNDEALSRIPVRG